MTYERQEQPFDPIANREREDERADYLSEFGAEVAAGTITSDESNAIVDSIQAERDEAVGRKPPQPRYVPLRAVIDAAWMEGHLTSSKSAKRYQFQHLAACDAEEQMADRFESKPSSKSFLQTEASFERGFGKYLHLRAQMNYATREIFLKKSRIQIDRITLSEGWGK